MRLRSVECVDLSRLDGESALGFHERLRRLISEAAE
jgi:hypothetical protein